MGDVSRSVVVLGMKPVADSLLVPDSGQGLVEYVEVDGVRLPREALLRAASLIYSWEEEGSSDGTPEAVMIYRIIRDALEIEISKK